MLRGRRGFLAGATATLVAGTGALVNARALAAVPAPDDSAWRLFGHEAVKVPNGIEQYVLWREVLRRGRLAASPAWRGIVERIRRRGGDDLHHLLAAANSVLNALPYRPDELRFRGRDRWLDPDTFVAFGGDCEDYAIAKYFALRRLGVAAERLRLVTGFEREGVTGHAVLAARVGRTILVLDNRFRWPRAEEDYPSFRPRLSFNEADLWLHR